MSAADKIRAWVAGAHDEDLIELEAQTLRAVLSELDQLRGERSDHTLKDAQRALIMLLLREKGEIEFTPAEMTAVPSGISFAVLHDVATGNQVVTLVLARRRKGRP